MKNDIVLDIRPLTFLWEVHNPFLFCAHHKDQYPAGREDMSPDASLEGRDIGQDFELKDGWRMYHGDTIPGFPVHPHRGFETVTIVLEGMVDHCDSWGQTGRYGGGDVQWMTAGAGLQHSEMFPLLNKDRDNPAELFQVWLNLPKEKKFAKPFYKMLWNENIPVHKIKDSAWKWTEIRVIAGNSGDVKALPPAPDSWAADPANMVSIWIIKMQAGAQWNLQAVPEGANRRFYFYRGDTIRIGDTSLKSEHSFQVNNTVEIPIQNGNEEAFIFLLQGKPINEPVVQYGPFVMNTEAEIRQTFADFRSTEFGGWPWPRRDMVNPREAGRFARYIEGKEERPGGGF
jgi:quercetin 2,3-dioxygenase